MNMITRYGSQQYGTTVAGLGADDGGFRVSPIWGLLSTASMGVSAYHGYKRNQSVGWAIAWGLLGAIFPVITPAIAFGQGFGKRKG